MPKKIRIPSRYLYMDSETKYSLLEFILFPPKGVNTNKLKRAASGKTILITGASFGIGESLAYMLADTGAHLILAARTEEKLLSVKKGVEQKGGKASIFSVDLTKPEQVQALINFISQQPNGIDVVINNAGKSIRRSIYESLDRYHDFTAKNHHKPNNINPTSHTASDAPANVKMPINSIINRDLLVSIRN